MKYFLMSVHFNKQSPSDFGLTCINNRFFSTIDGSEWKICCLYDFGVGRENGFYRLPLPKFENLIDIVVNSNDKEDRYGAASVIIYEHMDELFEYINKKEKKDKKIFIKKPMTCFCFIL